MRDCMWYHPPHWKNEWKLKANRWRGSKKNWKCANNHIPGYEGNTSQSSPQKFRIGEEGSLSPKQMQQVKRHQFLNFFEGFFKTYRDSHSKLKSTGISFKKEDKARILEHYFRKYYNENLRLSPKDQTEIDK